MGAINQPTGSNLGGIARLHYALQQNIAQLFDFEYERQGLTISQANLDLHFSRLKFVTRSANWNLKRAAAANTYMHSLEAQFMKMSNEITDHLVTTEHRKLCFIFKSHNGEWRILPLAEESADYRTGSDPQDANATTLAWTSELGYIAPKITII